jgi:2-aminoethylphosphonate-pyruvate transaminase
MILLTPGPCMTSATVRAAAAMPDMNHRDPAFIEILRDVKRRLLAVYSQMEEGAFGWPNRSSGEPLKRGGTWRPYLIGGSGTAAVEAMITSCVRTGPVLLVDSGYYSGRMRSKLEAHGIPFDIFSTQDWWEPINVPRLGDQIESRQYEAVLTTHNETTTGRLHPIGQIGELCNEHNIKLLVDAMSSFGADEIDLTHVDAVASSANKCLHGLPGLSFVLVRDWLSEEMGSYPPRTVYLSLPFYEGDSPPLTPPVPLLNALRQALIELGGKGANGRRGVYQEHASLIRRGLEERGFSFAIPIGEMSCTVTTASIPPTWNADEWFEANLHAGFMVYGTKGDLRDRWFQVANMGEITSEHISLWLAAVDDILTIKSPRVGGGF